jgi:hypothetical protein
VKSTPGELEVFEIEPDALKQMRNVCDPITASFEGFDLAIQALLKTARLTVEKVIGDLVEPVIERSQKGVLAFNPALFDAFCPSGDCVLG